MAVPFSIDSAILAVLNGSRLIWEQADSHRKTLNEIRTAKAHLRTYISLLEELSKLHKHQ